MSSSTNVSSVNMSLSPSTSGSVAETLATLVNHTVSVTMTLGGGVGDNQQRGVMDGCRGTHLKSHHAGCASGMAKGHNARPYTDISAQSVSSLDGLHRGEKTAKWVPFVGWMCGLALITCVTALLVYRCLRSNLSMRDAYEEIPEGKTASLGDTTLVGMSSATSLICSDGNASRRRFLESRRAAAAAAAAAQQESPQQHLH